MSDTEIGPRLDRIDQRVEALTNGLSGILLAISTQTATIELLRQAIEAEPEPSTLGDTLHDLITAIEALTAQQEQLVRVFALNTVDLEGTTPR